jgi:hypothetical protein
MVRDLKEAGKAIFRFGGVQKRNVLWIVGRSGGALCECMRLLRQRM